MFSAWCKHQYGRKGFQHRIYWNTKDREWQTRERRPVLDLDLKPTRQTCFLSPNFKHDPYEEKK